VPWIAEWMRFESAAPLLVAYVVAAALLAMTILRGTLRGTQEFGKYGLTLVAEAAIRLVAGAGLLMAVRVPAAGVAAYAVASLSVAAWLWLRVRRSAPHAAPVDRRELTALLGPMTLLVVSMAVFQNIDVLFAKRFFAAADAGTYAAVATLARWMSIVAMPIEALLLPRVTYLLATRADVRPAMLRIGGAALAMALVPLIVFAAIPALLLRTVYGAAFEAGAPLLLPVAAAVFMVHVAYIVTQALVASGRRASLILFASFVVIEAVVLLAWHPTLQSVAYTLVTTRTIVFLGTMLIALRSRR
jgi:O-antigen/teichoic acid export membrane protein